MFSFVSDHHHITLTLLGFCTSEPSQTAPNAVSTDGQGYVVEDATYRQHLQNAVEIKQVGPIVVDFVHAIHSATEINMQKSQCP
jgi:hypothetical protein